MSTWLRSDEIKLPAVLPGHELAALLTQLMKKKTSGRITLIVGDAERSVQMMRGLISSVSSKQPKEHLVERFRRRRRLNKQQAAAVQDLMQKESLRFGVALTRLKLVDAELFSTILGSHNAFLLGRCLRAKGVRVTLDTEAKGPADRAPIRFLDAVEQAVRAWPLTKRLALASAMDGWVVTLSPEDLALAKRLDPTPIAERILASASPSGVAVSVLLAQAGGRSARAALQALFLCGFLRPTEASLLRRPSRLWPFVATAALSFAAGAALSAHLLRSASAPGGSAPAPASSTVSPFPSSLPASSPSAAPTFAPMPERTKAPAHKSKRR